LYKTEEERRGAYRILVGKREGRRTLERLRGKWENNIKIGIAEVGWRHGLDRSGSGQGEVTCCGCCDEHLGTIKYRKCSD
jgi:hypothetical protein